MSSGPDGREAPNNAEAVAASVPIAAGIGLVAAAAQNPAAAGLAAMISAAMTSRRLSRVERFVDSLALRIANLDDTTSLTIDEAYLRSDNFTAIVETCLFEAARESNSSKFEFPVDFAAAAALIQPTEEINEIFTGLLSGLRGVHIGMLFRVYEVQKNIPDSDLLGRVGRTDVLPLTLASLCSALGNGNDELTRLVADDLVRLGLVRYWDDVDRFDPEKASLALTSMGKTFMRFVKLESVRQFRSAL